VDIDGLLRNGNADAEWLLILAHGAGQPMDSPFMAQIATDVSAANPDIAVWRFNFDYMAQAQAHGRRGAPSPAATLRDEWQRVIERGIASGRAPARVVIGGKSLGGRIASMAAEQSGVGGLVCLGYPFHPPGKPQQLRTAHLASLAVTTLICQGERDTFGSREEVDDYELSTSIKLHWLADGDHSFKPRKRSGYTEADNLAAASQAIVDFIEHLS
jgi:hypothetical protein